MSQELNYAPVKGINVKQDDIMMNDNLKLFLQRFYEDEALAARLGACKSEDEAYTLASSVQDGFTKEEFVETMSALNHANNSGDLTKEDLRGIAGGLDEEDTIIISSASISATTIGAMGAAAI